MPLSQIHYHFGSKQGMVLALFEYLNAQLLDRQNALFGDPTLKLSEQWDRACDYLDDDIASGYVRVLQELTAASWPDAEVAKVVRAGLITWFDLITELARKAERELGGPGSVAGRGGCRTHRLRVHGRGKPLSARWREERRAGAPGAAARRRSHSHCGRRIHRRGDVMRAKLPSKEGFAERDGVKIHYEVYGDGPQTMVFLPPWSIVHSRVYKAQLPYFSERFRCIAFDARGNGKSDQADGGRRLLARQLRGRRARRHGRDGCRPGRIWLACRSAACTPRVLAAYHPERVKAAILVGTVATIGPGYPYMTPRHFVAERDRFEGWDKYNRAYWLTEYPDFAEHFIRNICSEPHSTKQIEDGIEWAGETTGPVLVKTVEARTIPPSFDVGEAHVSQDPLPAAADPRRQRPDPALCARAGGGRAHGCRARSPFPAAGTIRWAAFPRSATTLINDFLDRKLGIPAPRRHASGTRKTKKALYLSSPIGLGHGRRDIAITRELRKLHPDLQVDWLAQDPVTRLLEACGERIHPLSARLASESRHIELESGEHDLNAFQAIRRMDEVLIANFMIFQDAVDEGGYDLVIADEAWDIDHYWHEHPELKKASLAWFTDFVGYVPMPSGGDHEAFLTHRLQRRDDRAHRASSRRTRPCHLRRQP